MEPVIRPAELADLPRLVEIYNHYVLHTPITFDLEPYTIEARRPWFDQFARDGRYRLLVAEEGPSVVGYAGTVRHRPKAAYDTSVETTIYLAPEATGRGIGQRLYQALFKALEGEDLHRALAGITEGNPASLELHRRVGFRQVAHFTEQGRKFGRYWDVIWMERPLP